MPRVDDRRVVSGIVCVIKRARMERRAEGVWAAQDALQPLIRWSRLGVFDRIFAALAGEGPKPERIMIDSTHLKAHRAAASLLKGGRPTDEELKEASRLRQGPLPAAP